jgi:16S rRNA (uracil1498-N3)-methyltransferase
MDNAVMRLSRIYHPAPLAKDGQITLTGHAANHVSRVLRLGEGAKLTLFNGDGGDYAATIQSIGRRDVTLAVHEFQPVERESPLDITLLQGICRGQRMDWLLQKCTELGVARIQPVLSDRVVVKLSGERAEKKLEHWRGVVIGACEQSGRAKLPQISAPESLQTAITCLPEDTARLVMDPAGTDRLSPSIGRSRAVIILTGPEGGLTNGERQAAIKAGFKSLRIGPRILRTETAPIVMISILQYLFGDLAGEQG